MFRNILYSKEYHLRANAFPHYLTGIDEHRPAANFGEVMLYLVVINLIISWKNILQKSPQFRNVPLPAAQIVQKLSFSFFGCHLKHLIE